MGKILGLFLIFLLILNCSLDKKSGFWTQKEKIQVEKNLIIKELFEKENALNNEFNANVKIQLKSKPQSNNFNNNLNNSGRVNFNGNLENKSKFKFSNIDNFDQFEPEIIFDENNIIFFDNKGSLLKFDNSSKLIWKNNFYHKSEKKLNPKLFFGAYKETLIIVDNLAKYYAVNLKTGKLIWSKTNSAPFNSQIKVYKDVFFVTDYENVLRCFSIKNGDEIWRVGTESTFIKSQKKLSLVLVEDKIIFNNSVGDISAVNVNTGDMIWQTPTQDSSIYENSFLLQTSDLVANKNSILMSNNKNEFFSISVDTGTINWQNKINSNVRPSVIDNLVFTVTIEGFLVVIDNDTGNIIRITNIFDRLKKRKKSNIKPVGFIVGTNNIYLTTDNGLLIIIEILSGRSSSILKIDNEKISRPFVVNKNLFIIKDNAIIKIN
mgnify:CR=1 FL=1